MLTDFKRRNEPSDKSRQKLVEEEVQRVFAAMCVGADVNDAVVANENRVLYLEQERKRQKIQRETVYSIK